MPRKKLPGDLSEWLPVGMVLTDREDTLCYGFDAMALEHPVTPAAVVLPQTTSDVVKIARWASDRDIPLFPRGAGTNLSGGSVPTSDGIVVAFSRMDRILELDPENMTATIQPGVVIDDLNRAVAGMGFFYPPDPGTVATATMGGSVAECSGGLRGLKYGVTRDYLLGLEVVLAGGQVLRAGGKTVKNVSGYNLVQLFCGSEGTLGMITEATVRLVPLPQARRSMLASFAQVEDAGRTVRNIISRKVIPATLEIMDALTVAAVEEYNPCNLPRKAGAVLLIEVDGEESAVERETKVVEDVCRAEGGDIQVALDEAERDKIWAARRSALPALARRRPTMVLEDATVPRSRVPDMLKALREIAATYQLEIACFGHAGDGNLHPTILTDAEDTEELLKVEKAVRDIFRTALDLGGTLTGEHGIGLSKKEFIHWEFGDEGVAVMAAIKAALDPQNILNPGKVIKGSEGPGK